MTGLDFIFNWYESVLNRVGRNFDSKSGKTGYGADFRSSLCMLYYGFAIICIII